MYGAVLGDIIGSTYEWHNVKSENLYIQRSYGNGAAMRVSAIGYAFESIPDILKEVKYSCYYTHHNREAIRGAQAIATAVFLARKNCDKKEIASALEKRFFYSLDFTLDGIRKDYVFDSRTAYTVPVAVKAFLESVCYEDAIRKAISVGGDSDTIACMTGGIAQAYYKKIPKEIFDKGSSILDTGLKQVLNEFENKYKVER